MEGSGNKKRNMVRISLCSELHSFRNAMKVTIFHLVVNYSCLLYLFFHWIMPGGDLKYCPQWYFKEILFAVVVWEARRWLTEWTRDGQNLPTPETNACNILTYGQNKWPRPAHKYISVPLCAGILGQCVFSEVSFCGTHSTHTFLSDIAMSHCQPRFGLCNVGCKSKIFKETSLEGKKFPLFT